jgi:hypothetical protein
MAKRKSLSEDSLKRRQGRKTPEEAIFIIPEGQNGRGLF